MSSASDGPPSIAIICFVALCICAPTQLYLLNLTLASGRATFTIPLYLSLTMLLTSLSGGVLFNEVCAIRITTRAPRRPRKQAP